MMTDQLIGQSLDRYKITKLLGEGGMGSVYRAFDLTLQREVAIKIMHAQFARQPDFQERFLQEARTEARLDHPGIVKVFDFGQSHDMLYIVMEFIPGDNLRKMLQDLRASSKWIVLPEAVQLVRQVCLALDYVHKQGILHRDIKPDNIMLKGEASEGLPYRPILTDLGLAKLAVGGMMTQEGTSMGTPAYMSPEQALGEKTDVRSDVYSLGILLFELAVGQLPFPAKTLSEAIHYHVQQAPPDPRQVRPDLPESVARVIAKALEKKPDDRYAEANGMAKDLAAALPAVSAAPTVLGAAGQPTALEAGASLMTQLQRSLLEPRGSSVLQEFPATPASLGQDRLQVMVSGSTAYAVTLKTQPMTIGRDQTNDIVLDMQKVSRKHARIEFDGASYQVTDLNSTNGTYLGDVKLLPGVPESWTPDKPLRIGDCFLKLERAQKGASPRTRMTVAADGTLVEADVAASSVGSDRVSLFMEKPDIQVAPGNSVTSSFVVLNQGTIVDHFGVSVTGIPADWIPSLPPMIQLLPGAQKEVTLTFQPPLSPKSKAGSYPIAIRATSQDEPDQGSEIKANLTVAPYAKFNSSMKPARLRMGQSGKIEIENQGNAPQVFTLSWQDRAEELAFTPPQANLTVAEGRSAAAEFQASPKKRQWIGREKTTNFTAQVISQTGELQTHEGELVSRSLVPQALIPVVLLLCLCLSAAAAAGIFYSRGKTASAHQTATALALAVQLTNAPTTTSTPAPAPTQTPAGSGVIPPTLAPDSPTPLPATPANTDLPSTPTSTPPPLVATIVHPASGEYDPAATTQLVFQVQAYDPAKGNTDGAGINNVDMSIIDSANKVVYHRTEQNAAYCSFGGGEPDCTIWVFSDHNYKWPDGSPIKDGNYTLKAQVNAKDGRTTQVQTAIKIHVLLKIIFISQRDGPVDLYSMYSDGSGVKRLTTNTQAIEPIAVSPDGTKVAFTATTTGNYDIYLVNTDGTHILDLTKNAAQDLLPIWSPNGKRIAFLSDRTGKQEVYVMNPDGSNVKQITSSNTTHTNISWSPDSKKILYSEDQGSEVWDIFAVNADGSGVVRLTQNANFNGESAYTPDGKHIVFISTRDNFTFKMWIMNADGSNPKLLTTPPNASDTFFHLSPDGKKVAFTSNRNSGTNPELYVMSLDGSSFTQVTPNSDYVEAYAWSPDGKTLAFNSSYDINVINVDGSGEVNLTNSPGVIDDSPSWQP
jgi:serine/threonine protein kinase/Tol biopolymer transport system component